MILNKKRMKELIREHLIKELYVDDNGKINMSFQINGEEVFKLIERQSRVPQNNNKIKLSK